MAGVTWANGRHVISDKDGEVADTICAAFIASPSFDWENDAKRLSRKTIYEESGGELIVWNDDTSVMEKDLQSHTEKDIVKAGKSYKTYWHITRADPLDYTLMVVWDASYTPPDKWWE